MDNSIYKGWDKPIPYNTFYKPEFNSTIFPKWLKDYIEAVAEETQTPIDASALISLAVLSTITGSAFKVNANKGNWEENLCLFVVVCLDPSNRKSSVFKMFVNKLIKLQIKDTDKLGPTIRKESIEIKFMKNRIEELEKKAAKVNEQEKQQELLEEIIKLETELQIKEKNKTIPVRFFSSDITIEKLAKMMQEHNDNFAILSSEGAEFFEMAAGRYSNKSNIDVYLKGYSGDSITNDRVVSEDGVFVEEASLTLGLFVQPSVLKNVPMSFYSRGLIQRFIISLPDSMIGMRKINPQIVPSEVKESYEKNLEKLYEQVLNLEDEKVSLKLSESAKSYLDSIQEEIEKSLGDLDSLSFFKDWLGKLVGNILRIAGLLHVSECIGNDTKVYEEISLETLIKADSIRNYFISHAEYLFDEGLEFSKDIENKNYILKKALDIDKQGHGKIEDCALWQAVKKKIKPKDVLNDYLLALENNNFIKVIKEGRKNFIYINPYFQKQSPNSPKYIKVGYING